MKKDPNIFLEHIIESIEWIEKYTNKISRDEFLTNSQIQDAVARRLEIIGEAAKKLDSDIKDKIPEIPWQKIAGMRDVLIHEYFGTDFNLIWNTVKTDLPQLKEKIKRFSDKLTNTD